MSSNDIAAIPSHRRDLLFCEIQRKVNEVEAIDRSLEGIGEGLAVDECLEDIADLMATEIQEASVSSRRKGRKRASSPIPVQSSVTVPHLAPNQSA